MKLYVDGQLVDSDTANSLDDCSGGGPLKAGAWNTASLPRFFDGDIKDVKVYDRPLGASEILQLHQGQSITNGLLLEKGSVP